MSTGDDAVDLNDAGTSLSAAIVTGIIGLTMGHHWPLRPQDALEIVLRTATTASGLVGEFEGGRVVAPSQAILCKLAGDLCTDDANCCSRSCSASTCGGL